ncbi:hypothetical protein [Leptolyngbya ohadii]|uniref:hypothetical protein n=1 Tax=Leptolyngbya ohadii TaxID=1962290 RepID=UPI00117BA9C7|nr:hypothetical protein [Leptolyngbya ohadii]
MPIDPILPVIPGSWRIYFLVVDRSHFAMFSVRHGLSLLSRFSTEYLLERLRRLNRSYLTRGSRPSFRNARNCWFK